MTPIINKEDFEERLRQELQNEANVTPIDASDNQIYKALSAVVVGLLREKRRKFSNQVHSAGKKEIYYLSMEFLMGRSLKTSLYNLEINDMVTDILKKWDVNIDRIYDYEPDAGLGNGGLGRLAACYLDGLATDGYPAMGYSICYEYGIFKQKIEDGWQTELPDNWLPGGESWLVPKTDKSIEVHFDGELQEYWDQQYHHVSYKNYSTVVAVPYDMYVPGYDSDGVSVLRLWKAKAPSFDMAMFNQGDYAKALSQNTVAQAISKVLYPNDNHLEGKSLRYRQQYFMCAASIGDIVNRHMSVYGTLDNLHEKVAIHINDTHPTLAIPELMRVLLDDCGYSWDKSWYIVTNTFAYTNHTVMGEALEKWNIDLFKSVIPTVYEIILMINDYLKKYLKSIGQTEEQINSKLIVDGSVIHMARMAIFASAHTNGVAQLHTNILMHDVLKDWYEIFPDRFQNKTNGITPRRWLGLCDPELSALITEKIGDGWQTDLDRLAGLKKFVDDGDTINRFMAIKRTKKEQLCAYIKEHEGIDLSPDFAFDIQVKRLHEYKRQLLNAFSIMDLYFQIKDHKLPDLQPTAFIFGAKAAPAYRRAKGIIKYINEVAKLVNNDPDTKDKLKVIFVQNYNVSYAEKLIPAADISEQISTAGLEASGTGNMKFMLNGAVTLGTYDGANVEIVEEAGWENEYIFGARVEEIDAIKATYKPKEKIYNRNDRVKRVVNTLVDGTFNDGDTGMFGELFNSLINGASWHKPDNYFLLTDLEGYVDTKLRALYDYKNRNVFSKKCWMNIASAGKFSSDRTVRQYAEELWKL